MHDTRRILSEKASSIAAEQPLLWEFRLYAQVLIDETERNKALPFAPPNAVAHITSYDAGATWLASHLKTPGPHRRVHH
jgi:hypothetical protein